MHLFTDSSCVTKDQCQHRGACIVFTVMDHDLFLTNDFAGEVYFSLNNIPGIKGEEVSGFSALSPLCLPLTHPKKANPSKCLLRADWKPRFLVWNVKFGAIYAECSVVRTRRPFTDHEAAGCSDPS